MINETVWVIGAQGRLGSEITKRLSKKTTYRVVETDKEVDITDLEAVERFAERNRPDTIINAAGIVDHDFIEDNPLDTYRVNAIGARNVAIASNLVDARLVHLSSDHVFPGSWKIPVSEFDTPAPFTTYGKSKLAGENFVRTLCPRHIIVRSSWVYGGEQEKLLKDMIERIKAGEKIEVYSDQFSSPTSVASLSRFIIAAIKSDQFGTFHASDNGSCSRYEFVKKSLEFAGLPTNNLVGKFDENSALYLLLDNMMLKLTNIYHMPKWEDDLQEFISKRILREEA